VGKDNITLNSRKKGENLKESSQCQHIILSKFKEASG
jgi:hypothetical protein